MTDYADLVSELRLFEMVATSAAADAIEDLQSWKNQMIELQSTWEVQAVGKLLKLPLGANILPAIQPAIEALIKENEMLKDRLAEAGWREEYRRNMNT